MECIDFWKPGGGWSRFPDLSGDKSLSRYAMAELEYWTAYAANLEAAASNYPKSSTG